MDQNEKWLTVDSFISLYVFMLCGALVGTLNHTEIALEPESLCLIPKVHSNCSDERARNDFIVHRIANLST